MRSLVGLLTLFSPRAAVDNARAELALDQSRRASATELTGRIDTIDIVAGRRPPAGGAQPAPPHQSPVAA